MQLIINGEARQCADGINVAALVQELGLNASQIAMERNGVIVPGSAYAQTALAAGDRIEIVKFIGGG